MNSLTKAILETIGSAGYTIHVNRHDLTATDQKTNERFIVRYDDDIYVAAVELTQQIGIELEDE